MKNAPKELMEEKFKSEANTYQKLGEILINAGRINKKQLEEAGGSVTLK